MAPRHLHHPLQAGAGGSGFVSSAHTWPSGAGPGGHGGEACLNTLPHELVVPRQPACKGSVWAGCSRPPYSDGHFYYY